MKLASLNTIKQLQKKITSLFVKKSDLYDKLTICFLNNSSGNLGDCAVVHNSSFCLISDFGWENDCASLINYLDSQNITKIDYIVISHYHNDHIGGTNAVGFSVFKDHGYDLSNCKVYLPHKDIDWTKVESGSMSQSQYNIKTWLSRIDGCQVIEPTGTLLYTVNVHDNLSLNFFNINPSNYNTYYNTKENCYGNTSDLAVYNNFSMCFVLKHYGNRILFTGDIEAIAQTLNHRYIQSVDLYKMEHHGLNAIVDYNYLNAVSPKYAVVCNNSGNFYIDEGAPSIQKMKKTGVKFYNTMHGTVRFESCYSGLYQVYQTAYKAVQDNAPISTDYDLFYGKLIHDVDLNSIKSPGIYSCRNGTLGNTVKNKPIKDDGTEYTNIGFKLIVEKLTFSTAIVQTITFIGDNRQKRFVRYWMNNSEWSVWKSINPSRCFKHIFTADDFKKEDGTSISVDVKDSSFCYLINSVMSMSMFVLVKDSMVAFQDFIQLPAEVTNITPANVQIPAFTLDGKMYMLYLQYATGKIRTRVAVPASTTLYFNFCTIAKQDRNI